MTGKPSRELIPYEERAAFWVEKVYAATSAMVSAYARALRERGINQEIIASRLERDKAQISRWLSGQKNLTVRTLSEMALALECDLRFEFISWRNIPAANFHYTLPETEPSGLSNIKFIGEAEKKRGDRIIGTSCARQSKSSVKCRAARK